jgi:ADP-ribosylglycohydrolase
MNQIQATPESSIDNRIRGAIWGQFVGDAFCLGSHWIYDLAEVGRRFPGGPQGFDTPAEGHYHFGKRSGELTHYGDGALLQLQSLAERGSFDAVDFGSRFVALMESSDYPGYRDHAAKGTVANALRFSLNHPGESYDYQDGADDDQPATVSRLAPVVALCYRTNDCLAVVERATRVCQNNNRAVAYAQAHALILRELISGNPLQEAFQKSADFMAAREPEGTEVADRIKAAIAARDRDVTTSTLHFGQSCPLEHSFPAAIQCTLRHGSDFSSAIKATAAAGGDNAARAAMAGAWLGAALGVGAIPADWRERLVARDEIATRVELIVTLSHRQG